MTTLDLFPALNIDQGKLNHLCDRWKIEKLELFGSVLREDFHDDSDIDLLVTWQRHHGWSLFDLVTMHMESV